MFKTGHTGGCTYQYDGRVMYVFWALPHNVINIMYTRVFTHIK